MLKAVVAATIASVGVSLLAGSSFGAQAKAPTTIDITTPDSKSVYMVWVNGKFHKVTVQQKVSAVTDAGGLTKVMAMDDPIDSKVQFSKLPPRDPAYGDIGPTEAQIAEMEAALDIAPDGSPASPPPGMEFGRPSAP